MSDWTAHDLARYWTEQAAGDASGAPDDLPRGFARLLSAGLSVEAVASLVDVAWRKHDAGDLDVTPWTFLRACCRRSADTRRERAPKERTTPSWFSKAPPSRKPAPRRPRKPPSPQRELFGGAR